MRKMTTISLSLSLLLFVSIFAPIFMVVPVDAQTTPIKIGIFAPFSTAGLDFYAPWTKQGFELGMIYATTEMGYDNENMTEGGRPYELYYYDTQGSPTLAASLATDAIEIDGIDILVGGTYSSVAAAIAPIAEDYEKLYFISPAADASLTAANFNPYCFRIARNNWHDAYAGVTFAMDENYLNFSRFAFLAADYSFGYSGVESMSRVIEEKGGTVVAIQYAGLFTAVWDSYMTALINADLFLGGIDYLFVIWAGSFAGMYDAFDTYNLDTYMNISGACIDIKSMNEIEAGMTGNDTYVNATGLCVYGYDLPNNAVNDWMVAEHVTRNIRPNADVTLAPGVRPEVNTFRAPELFTASGFATAQFLVDVTNAVTDLDTDMMIDYLEGGITIATPKGDTYLRPDDHQGLAEMYIARAVNDTRSGSETENLIIAELVETLPWDAVAPPIEAMWNGEPYVPGGFAPPPTTTPPTTTPTGTAPPPVGFDILTVAVISVGTLVLGIVIAAVIFRKR